MSRILLEGGIIILLVLMGISVFVPDGGSSINNVIVDFENDVANGEIVSDGELGDIEVVEDYGVNFVARINCKISN